MASFGTRVATWLVVIGVGVGLPTGASAAAGPPTGPRAWELVSPPDKRGSDIVPDARRTRAASDGSAIQFISLAAFGDALGTGIATEYVSVRATDPAPGPDGWATHSIMPRQEAGSFVGALTSLEPLYVGEFSDDLQRGVFFTRSPITDDPLVERALNLYRRGDLRTPGEGFYELVTECPLCELLSTPLPPLPGSNAAFRLRPELAATSPGVERVVFESQQRLTADTPNVTERIRLYEWDGDEVRLVGRIPRSPEIVCDDVSGPACVPFEESVGAQGNTNDSLNPHMVSDASDGHQRVFFTTPTDESGTSVDPEGREGNVFVRLDGTSTVRLNVSERAVADRYARAQYWDASVDGSRVLISTTQALTDDAPTDGQTKLYMYDTSKPASAPDNLTLVGADAETDDQGEVVGAIGLGGDDPYVYYAAACQLLDGEELLGGGQAIYLWHAGSVRYVGRLNDTSEIPTSEELLSTKSNMNLTPRQARVTPDGRRLLFSAFYGSGLTGYDHGNCPAGTFGSLCRELYLYDADSGELACASCNPSGAPATRSATVFVREFFSGANPTEHEPQAMTDDGSRVFFSTAEALVPEDENGRSDAYEYEVATGTVRLISSGRSSLDAWFLDASSDGRDVFFLTRERLVGWDVDNQYDLYDARIGGGFPEPPAVALPCAGEACQGPAIAAPPAVSPASAAIDAAGNVTQRLRPRGRRGRAKQCRRGFVKKRVRGRRRCVRRTRVANSQRIRLERRGS